MRKKYYLVLLFSFLAFQNAIAQNGGEVLALRAYHKLILESHPVKKQADLQNEFASAELLKARGGFDPKLDVNYEQKEFKETDYFRIGNASLKVPLGLGLTAFGSYEDNQGVFLNNQLTVPENGLWAMGIEANLLRGLFTDERRTMLRKAKLSRSIFENYQRKLINDLLLLSTYTYNSWYAYTKVDSILDESVIIAKSYLQATKSSYEQGDKPAIDTLEAYLTYQDRFNRKQENAISLNEAVQNVKNFVWEEDKVITIVNRLPALPVSMDKIEERTSIDSLNISNFPEVVEKQLKISDLQFDLKLNREMLKPNLSVKFSPLLSTQDNVFDTEYTVSNYKWGLDFSFPLLLRKERGEVLKTKLKIQESELELQNKSNEVANKLIAVKRKLDLLEAQKNLIAGNVANYKRLLETEQIKFELGESSFFLLNSREQKYLESRIKLVETEMKLQNNFFLYLFYSNSILDWSTTN